MHPHGNATRASLSAQRCESCVQAAVGESGSSVAATASPAAASPAAAPAPGSPAYGRLAVRSTSRKVLLQSKPPPEV